jgi:asparagine synthase (glutamine-hydrolysing)
MSGLAGWIDFDRDMNRERGRFATMLATLRHRGPKGERTSCRGHAVLGARLSACAARNGTADAAPRNDNIIALLDGHIANVRTLAEELQARSEAPEDLLVAAYGRWGIDFVAHLAGGFAVALWDEASGTLLLARDRFGVKPLYWFAYPNGLIFGSEPKAIMANELFVSRLDLSKLPILLQPRLTQSGETPLIGLREVSPAHCLTFRASQVSERRYWSLESAPHRDDFATTAARVRALLGESVVGETAGETDLGAMLSGGIDSSSVVALAAQQRTEPVRTYCVRVDDGYFVASDLRPDIDAPFAVKAAAFFGTQHREIAVTTRSLLDAASSARHARDLPGWGQFDASMHVLFGEMAREGDIALTGEAADEFLGGYPYFFRPDIIAGTGFPWLGDGPRLSDQLAAEVRRYVDPREDERARYEALLASVPRLPGEDPENARMREIFWFGMAGPLAMVLDRKDRMSAAWGLDVRIPFCNHRLVEYLWNVPWRMKCQGGVKGVLKAAMTDLLPSSTLNRRKSAYPHAQSPDHDRLLIAEVRRIAADTNDPVRDFFAPGALEELIATLESGAPGRMLPGGASPAYMLIHVVELSCWLGEYRVSIG